MKLRITRTMAFKTLLIDKIEKMLGASAFSLLRNEARFKLFLVFRKQVNNDLGVSLLALYLINFSTDGFIAAKNIFHKFVP